MAVAQHEVREIKVEFVRRDIGAFRHEAEITQGARIHDALETCAINCVELFRRRAVNQIKQARKTVAEIKTPTAAMADIKDAAHLFIQQRRIGEIWVVPVNDVTGWRFEAAFAHLKNLARQKAPARNELNSGWAKLKRSKKAGGRGRKRQRALPTHMLNRLCEFVERFLEATGMAAFSLRQCLKPVCNLVETFVTSRTGHARIHVRVFVSFASNRSF